MSEVEEEVEKLHPETGQVFPTAAGVTKFFESSVRTMK